MSQPAKIGITGGIGTGKSLFCKFLVELGEKVLYADDIAKEILQNDETVKSQIIELLGKEAYKDKNPNKKYIAEAVFGNPQQLAALNSIVHPPVTVASVKLMDSVLLEQPRVFYEAALIFESGMRNLFDVVVLITAPMETRILRVMERDNVESEAVLARMESQFTESEKIKLADYIINNDTTPESLHAQVITLLGQFDKKN